MSATAGHPTAERVDRPGLARAAPIRGGIDRGRRRAPWMFLTPVLVHALVFQLVPIGFLLFLSVSDWDGLAAPQYIAGENYEYLFTRDPLFLRTILNTFLFAGGIVLVAVPLGFVAAFVAWRSRAGAVLRIAFCLPMITNVVAIGFLGRYLFDRSYGAVNVALGWLGFTGPEWLIEPNWAMLAVVLMSSWIIVGHNMLLFSAGLTTIDESLYDAARLDGAGTVEQFRHITIPLMRPVTVFALITTFLWGIGNFALILVMTEGGPFSSTTVTGLYMYESAFRDLHLGRASAMAVVLAGLALVVALVQLRLFRRGAVET